MIAAIVIFYVALLAGVLEDFKLPELITIGLGFLAPIVIQFVKNRYASKTARFYISLLLSAVIGFAAYALAPPEQRDPVAFVVTVFGYATVAYNVFWKPIWENTVLGSAFLKKR